MRHFFCVAFLAALLLPRATWAKAGDDLNPVTMHQPPAGAKVALVADGQAVATICVMGTMGRQLQRAVTDLQTHIQLATGAKLVVAVAPAEITGPALIIGDCPQAAAAGLVGANMPDEGFAIKTGGQAVYIVGHDELAACWGIYEFLERFLGVRWYWPDELGVSVPSVKDLAIAPVWLSDAPVFRKREIWPSGGPTVAPAKVGDLHLRLRSADTWPTRLIVHAPHGWAKTYAKERPEIFQLRRDGQRDFEMLCYGNQRTVETYLEEIALQVAATAPGDPQRQIVNDKAITVSPADMAVSCTCSDCRALWNDAGGQYGTASKVLGVFVAKLAAQVKQRWPEMTVIFLPYKNYTYAPENVSFPGNVEVQICGMPGLAQHKEPAIAAAEQANIDAWMKASGRKIQNWHYSCWPADRTRAAYLFPHVIAEHYRENRDKTIGTFINGVGNHWPRQHVSLYAWMKLLWNPQFDVDAAIDEYCRRMYGAAAKTMRQLVALQIDGWEKSRWPEGKFSPKALYETSYPAGTIKQMEQLLEQALDEAKGDELVGKRLEYYALPLREFFAEAQQYQSGAGIRTLQVLQADEEPELDGRLNDKCWADALPLTLVMAQGDKPVKYPTTVQAVWTRQGVTFAFRMSEPTPEQLKRDIQADSRDASLLWWDDNVELFLDPSGARGDYYQFIVNSHGAILDGHGGDTSWTAAGVRSGVEVGADFWCLEVYVPLSVFAKSIAPGTGVSWYGNFTRHRVTDRKDREYQRLNTTGAAPSNDMNAFGPLKFIER